MSTPNTKLWVGGTVVAAVALLLLGWFAFIGPKRAEASDLAAQKVQVDSQNTTLQGQIAQLKAQFADLPARQAELAAIRTQLPDTAALPTLIRDLSSMAAASGVSLESVTPGAPVAFQVAGQAVKPGAAAAPSTGSTGAAGTTGTTGHAATQANGLFGIPVTVLVKGDFFKAELFLKKAQAEMQRAFLIQNLTVAEDKGTDSSSSGSSASSAGNVAMTLTGQVFVLKDAPAVSAAQAAGSGSAPSPQPSGTTN